MCQVCQKNRAPRQMSRFNLVIFIILIPQVVDLLVMEPLSANLKSKKRAVDEVVKVGDVERDYRFKVLLPNGISVGLVMRNPKLCMPFEEFLRLVKDEYDLTLKKSKSMKPNRPIDWNNGRTYVEDANDGKIRKMIEFKRFTPFKCHILRLYDGHGENANTFENMWDLTPDTDLLMELPEQYTFETALADLIDNSLQAIWTNGPKERKLISVEISEDRITVFDSGPGMDDSDENSIVKWGKMGASLHRSYKVQGIGGKPPYLMPFFGMFGYGGLIASMHLGRSASVSSKTKLSKKVYTLQLKREALLEHSDSELTWRTKGGVRAPLEAEIAQSPHGSFTKVQISKPKLKRLDKNQLLCKLKDIYFPYIQCDEVSNTGKTMRPIEFQVNGVDLAEVEGGEVAVTNLHSCNGPDFVVHLHFHAKQDGATARSPGSGPSQEANARLKCVYFPIEEGKESMEMITEKLKLEGSGVNENYENFSRVSIRRLGRLLPDARWALLPFMDLRQKKGDKASLLKRCCMRAKCFIDTDAGFNPTPSKTDLAHHNPFNKTLKNFGVKALKEEKEINVEIYRDGKLLSALQLEKDYQNWLLQMHDHYDEEIDCGEDEPVLVVNPKNKKLLGIKLDVFRVHKVLKRKGKTWSCGQNIKVVKGACAGVHKNNIYATLECFVIEGLQGDAGGEARIICRPLGTPEKNGCVLALDDGIASLDVGSSLSLPISVIDSGKCLHMNKCDWDLQVEKQLDKAPSTVDLLNATECQELEIDGVLPVSANAEEAPPRFIVAVLRPASFCSRSKSTKLDQKYIVKSNAEMVMEVKFTTGTRKLKDDQHIYSERVTPSSCKGYQGLYIFKLGSKLPNIFQKAGSYTFSFCLSGSSCKSCEKKVLVKGSSKIGKWRILSNKESPEFSVRVGSLCPPLSIACEDIYGNPIPFASIPDVMVKFKISKSTSIFVPKFKKDLSANKMTLNIKDVVIESNELDTIRPHYKATLVISSSADLVSVSIPCQVTPGSLKHVIARPPILTNILLRGFVINELKLEMFDAFGNHVEEGLEVELNVDGFRCEDIFGLKRKVDNCGCIDLGGLLKVTADYGKNVSFSVLSENEVIFMQEFQTENRELKVSSGVPGCCTAGSIVEDVVFEVVDSRGDIDVTVHDDEIFGESHTLTIKSASISTDDLIRYAFRHGRCTVPAIPLPQNEGLFCFVAAHSRYSDLHLSIKIPIIQAQNMEPEIQSSSYGKKMLLLEASPSVKNVDNMMVTMVQSQKVLENDILKYGERIGIYEDKLKRLNVHKSEIEQKLASLQASNETRILNHGPTREEIIRRIESKVQSAAAIICGITMKFSPQRNVIEEVVGLVALMGTISTKNLCTDKLSRILAEYLGEDQMLAMVCRSFEAALALETYRINGEVDSTHALHAQDAELGNCTVSRFHVICLEDISPYTGVIDGTDPQRRLFLPDPILPMGNVPPGFLGYAVNMVNLDDDHISIRTAAGHGLRETLFYRLFGKLQVYRTREYMIQARTCIKHGAVSLDGGILRENGITSFGHGNPEICFPVAGSDIEKHSSPEIMEKAKDIEIYKSLLNKIIHSIDQCTEAHQKTMKKFKRRGDKFAKLLNSMEPLLLEYHQPDVKIENL